MRLLGQTSLVLLDPIEWTQLKLHLLSLGYHWSPEESGHKRRTPNCQLWTPDRTKCVSDFREGDWYVEMEVLSLCKDLPGVQELLQSETKH